MSHILHVINIAEALKCQFENLRLLQSFQLQLEVGFDEEFGVVVRRGNLYTVEFKFEM